VPELTIIVPFFNEERTIGKLVQQLGALPPKTFDCCIFVDDGSEDNSHALLESALDLVKFDYLVIQKSNGGKASAIQFASQNVKTSHTLILDADLELDTRDVIKMWKIVTDGTSDVVFGYRLFLAQSSFTYRFTYGNKLISHIFGILYNEVITDIMCGFKLIPSDYLQSIPFRFSKFAVEVEIPLVLWLQRVRPYEIEVAYTPRSRAEGKVIGVRDALQVIFDMLWFRIQMKNKRR